MNIARTYGHYGFGWWLLGAIALVGLVVALVFVSIQRSDQTALVGRYRVDIPIVLNAMDIPDQVDLDRSGIIRISKDGILRSEGMWWWDGEEGWVRSDVPELDMRIRGYHGWTGLHLTWRLQVPIKIMEEVPLKLEDR